MLIVKERNGDKKEVHTHTVNAIMLWGLIFIIK